MKRQAIEQLPRDVAELVTAAQEQRVVITRGGVPYALVVGVENKDEEDLELEFSREFWRMIEERRRETDTVSLEELKTELEVEEARLANGTSVTAPEPQRG